MVVWEEEDQPQAWAEFLPALRITATEDDTHESPARFACWAVLLFARLTKESNGCKRSSKVSLDQRARLQLCSEDGAQAAQHASNLD